MAEAAAGKLGSELCRNPRMAPRTDRNANTASGGVVEIGHTFVEIDVPLSLAPNQVLDWRDRVRRTCVFANTAVHTKFIGAKDIWRVGYEGQISEDVGQAEA